MDYVYTLYNAHGLTKCTTKTVFGDPASCMPRSIVGFTDEVIEEKYKKLSHSSIAGRTFSWMHTELEGSAWCAQINLTPAPVKAELEPTL